MSRRRHPDSQSPHNPQTTDSTGDEFTRAVKRRLASSTRTGQACDRCKVRKIRCDGLPGGCSPCIQNRNECRTTDRISQKAVPRGHLENLERQVAELTVKNQELQAQLAIQVQQNNGGYALQDWTNSGIGSQRHDPSADRWRANGRSPFSNRVGSSAVQGAATVSRPVSVVPGTSGAHYLGMSSEKSCLGNMRQMALKLLGVDIDLSVLDLPNDGIDGSESNDGVLRSIFNIGPLPKAELPPKEESLQLIDFYFKISHSYLPILHKPTFMAIVDRVYSDPTYQPTVGQTVCIHMVLAIVLWQNAANARLRNTPSPHDSGSMFSASRNHYHYALSHFYEINASCTFEDLQAVALLLQHMRSFPKPGRSWLMARSAIAMCVELGVHRSAKNWQHDGAKPSCIEIEIRKRVFYCILTLEVSFAGKLGRPMSLRETDWDVELPERIEDESITETGIVNSPPPDECSIDVALDLFRHAIMTIKIHTTLYCTKRPNLDKLYVEKVKELERELDKAQKESILSLNSDNPLRQYQAAQALSWYHESRILMRHPSLNLSPSPKFTEECTRICVDSARHIIHLSSRRRTGGHTLDTTWYGATVQLMAAVTILYSVWVKGKDATPEEVEQMKKDMELCQAIMADLDKLLGTQNQLENVVRILTQGTLKLLFPAKDERQPRIPSIHSDSRSPPPLPSFSSGPSGFPPTIATSPILNHTGNQGEQSSRASSAFQGSNSMTFIDPSVAHSDNTNNTNPVYTFQTSQAGSFNTDPVQGPTVFWPWGSNSNWTKFSQDLSYVTTDLTPPGLSQEVYDGVTGLAALQAQSTFLQTTNGTAAGGVGAQGIGLGTSHVLAHNPHVNVSPSPSPYPHTMHQNPAPWTASGSNYSFSDATLRAAPPEH